MRKSSIRGYLSYLFSALALFFCINTAHALKDQLFECIVPHATEKANYKVQWIVSKGNAYSTFGKALPPSTDADGNLVGLTNISDSHTDSSNYWSIKRKKGFTGTITWEITYVSNSDRIFDAKELKCKNPTFNQTLATAATTYFNDDDKTDDQLSPWRETNPLRLVDMQAHNLQIAEEGECTDEVTENKVGEKTTLITKKRCCNKKMCVLL